eukprot:Gregarina_sp_Poly_1__1971@NODE_1516_length_3961_cov_48_948896_g1004_i0_p3_GENE_NODE_1516_length_3961_cov_48_948896_g1004_i0NODE_1516_length_3961_cov_48_948896_g1004_i0_p3_ORF_typecomplete_len108_score7_48_NODE_1516_length_3961_cov_48_948896_g1004_i034003723
MGTEEELYCYGVTSKKKIPKLYDIVGIYFRRTRLRWLLQWMVFQPPSKRSIPFQSSLLGNLYAPKTDRGSNRDMGRDETARHSTAAASFAESFPQRELLRKLLWPTP